MKKISLVASSLLLPLFLAVGAQAATVFFEEDFEGTFPGTYPEWIFPPVFIDSVGPGNFYETSTATCYTGSQSLRFNYNARNGFCNICGSSAIPHSPNHDGANYFVSKNAEDVTNINNIGTTDKRGPAAEVGNIVYNKSAGYSQWQITSITNENAVNDRVELNLLKPGIGGEAAVFNANDAVAFTRTCGVNGIIGIVQGEFDINRRIDCNNVIGWFQNIKFGVQDARQSIFRRLYLKTELSGAPSLQKLHYWTTIPTPNRPFGSSILLDTELRNGQLQLLISGMGQIGGEPIYKASAGTLPADAIFERGVWYYLEEEFKPESAPGAQNGVYRLWFSKASETPVTGSSDDQPLLEVTGLELGPIEGGDATTPNNTGNPNHTSFFGNTQHWEHTVGYWYMDDMKITDEGRIGHIPQSCTDTAPPRSPATN